MSKCVNNVLFKQKTFLIDVPPVMKEGFIFNWTSLKYSRKFASKKFGGGGKQKRGAVAK